MIEDIFQEWMKRVYALQPTPDKVIFCENNSEDKTLDLIYTFGNKSGISTDIIRFWTVEPKSLPWERCYDIIAHARQLLLTRARRLDPDFAIFIDSDILIDSTDLIEGLTTAPNCLVGGAYLREFPEGRMIATLFKSPISKAKNRLRNRLYYPLEEVLATSAGCLSIPRKILQDRRINFYPLIEGWAEDFGYCKQARDSGYRVYLDGTIQLTHRIRGKWKSWSTDWAKKDGRI